MSFSVVCTLTDNEYAFITVVKMWWTHSVKFAKYIYQWESNVKRVWMLVGKI